MRTLYPNLDREMNERKMTYLALADVLGMHPQAVYRRLMGISQWTLPEVVEVCRYFDNYDVRVLFLRLDIKS